MIGINLAHYEITSHIGSGGMGDVYQATDTKLGRSVAIKFLPEAFSHDTERVSRFQREARVLASLNHSNIAAIHGLEEIHNRHFLVMELVPGETLADRIKRGAIPLAEAIPIARQIADALEAAHEQGIIHRDLKPANVKVREDGTVKVLDFGLAKAIEPAGTTSSASQSPTITSPAMTQAGIILGTAAYMSPEQAKGRAADKRSDVWAFGAVLYEMLTGKRAFDGEDMVDVLGAVARLEPDWAAVPHDVPLPIRTLVQNCLVKNRLQRVSDISTAKFIIKQLGNITSPQTVATTPAGSSEPPRSGWHWLLPAAMAAALTAIIIGTGTWVLRPSPSPPVVVQFSFTLPEGQSFSGGTRQMVAISRDGTRLAYVANSRIYIRSIGHLQPRAVPGTELTKGASLTNPMFAPDGESIARRKLSSAKVVYSLGTWALHQ